MMEKFKNKYRIPSARLQTWDYGNNGAYFITICTKNREHYFGEIANDKMHLNEIGKLADELWVEIPDHFPFIELGIYVVMPNHVHGILIIDKTDYNTHTEGINDNFRNADADCRDAIYRVSMMNHKNADTDNRDADCRDANYRVSMMNHKNADTDNRDADCRDANYRVSMMNHINADTDNRDAINRVSTINGGVTGKNNPMFYDNISRIIRWYKGRCTFEIHKINPDFEWQPRFHDHIIRDSESFERIQNYIADNPKNWKEDKFYS